MDVTRNEQTISFIIDNGDLMQITPYVSKAGDAHRPMRTYLIDGMTVDAQDRALARQAAREWNAQIDNYSHADDEYAILKPTDDPTTADAAPAVVADPAEVLAGKVSELLSVIGQMQFGQGDDGIVAQTLTALADYRTATRAAARAASGIPVLDLPVDRVHVMSSKSDHDTEALTIEPRFPEGTPEYAVYKEELTSELDKFVAGEPPYGIGTVVPDRQNPAEDWPDRYAVKFTASDAGDVISMEYVRYADAAAYFWQLVATHESDGSSVPVSTNPLALRREGIDSTWGITHRWMVSLDVVTGS